MARLSDPADRQIAEEAMLEERDHAVVLRTLAGGTMPTPRSTLDTILRRERWHVRGTGWIGDAIYGVNDGLGAVFGIVSGMAGYTGGSEVVLAAGLAGTLASALSMGAGAYLVVEVRARGLRVGGRARAGRDRGGPARRAARARAVLPAQGVLGRRSRARWPSGSRRSRSSFCARSCTKSSGLSEETFPEPVALDAVGDRLDRHRRLHPDHPVLLHRRHAGRHRLVRHQHPRALRRRRVEGARHDAVVVGQRRRDDGRRHHRSGHHLRPRPRVRGTSDDEIVLRR